MSARDAARPAWVRTLAEVARALPRDTFTPLPAAPPEARSSAVLMLLGDGDEGPDLLLTERSHAMRSHPGQVSFPGGRREPSDRDAADTALREAAEEVGVQRDGVDVIATLPTLWIPYSNSAVTTVIGWWRAPSPVSVVDPAEVASVHRVPVAALTDPGRRHGVRLSSGWTGPAFDLPHGLVLWGFTALVVDGVLRAAGWEQPWDRSRIRPAPLPGLRGGA